MAGPCPVRSWRICSPWIGDLRIEEIRDEQLMRYVRTARVLVLDRPRATDVLGELFEPQIIAMSPQAFTLSGFERVGDQCYAQSWLVREIERRLERGRRGARYAPRSTEGVRVASRVAVAQRRGRWRVVGSCH